MNNESEPPESNRVVAIATVVPLWRLHYAADLEIAAEHMEQGDEVHLLTCMGGLASCAANPRKERLMCLRCASRQRQAISALGLPRSQVHVIPDVRAGATLPVESFDDLVTLNGSTTQTGRAAAGSLVSHLRDPEPDIAAHASLVSAMYASAEAVHRWTTERLETLDAGRLYLFNGRFVNALPALTAARQLQVPVIAHERNWNYSGFIVRRSGSVHSLEEINALLDEAKQAVQTDPAARSRAIQWYEGRRFPLGGDLIQRFTADQSHGSLPPGFDPRAKNIAVFVSSEDEYVALSEWKRQFHDTQEETIVALSEHEALDADVVFWVRVHPNLAGLVNAQTLRLEELKERASSNVHVIPADSGVDSYALAEAADVVVTFGSTMGAEAIYWGTPSIVLGRARYEALDSVIVPHTLDELVASINRGLPKPAPESALAFGALMTATGRRFTRFREGDGSRPATFKGVPLQPSWPIRAVIRMATTGRRLVDRVRRRDESSARS